ncbi:MAG: hypothetical protein JRI68_15600, partial [Deltaproteobacteria bacterium]|nr:hypothetical protein [Deltaproteobacteria bacterium]
MSSVRKGRAWSSTVVTTALAIWLVGTGAAAGCATASDPTFDDDDDDGSSTTSDGGSTSSGIGGGGGNGGTTTSSPCAVDCTQIQAPVCQIAQCNAQTGQCEVVADADATACDDGVFCTADDACLAGICAPGPDNDCGLSPAACQVIACDENSQTCATTASQNGDPCVDPNDLCLENATCTNGICNGTAKDCFMQPVPDDCHVSECNPQNGQCEPVIGNEGGACSDPNDLCTVNKTCTSGVCQGGSPKDCSHMTQGCVMGVCDVNNGQCTTQQVGQGQPCDDLDFCTSGETCNNGSCTGGTAITQCIANDNCCPNNCTPQNDQDCAVILLFDSWNGTSTSASVRQAGSSCGTQVAIGNNPVTITKIAVRNDLQGGSGNHKFVIHNHDNGDLNVYTSAPQSFTGTG